MRIPSLAVGFVALGVVLATGAVTPATADPLKCKATITKASAQYVQARTKALVKCEVAVVAGKLPLATDCSNESKTDAALDKAKAKMEAAIEKACGGPDKDCGSGGDDEPLGSIGWDMGVCPDIESLGCAIAIDDCHDVVECLECVQSEAVDQVVELACDELLLPSTSDKTLNKCQQTIGKATAAFVAAKTKALAKCWDAVNKGAISGPCPSPGDGKADAAIAAAEAKKIAAICKACGGADKGCDQTVTGPTSTVPGTGGTDDLTPAAIGFPADCAELTIPGGASCQQPIATLADIVECVDCIAEFKVDCVDRLAVPWAASYPGECNPGCGNGILETGEECDGAAGPCPGSCAPAIVADGCTCPTGSFTMDAVAGADLDTGWTGIAHDQGALIGHVFEADTYGCSSGGPDTECSFVGRYATPYFGAPLPLSSGGVPICVLNEVVGVTNGTLELTTGDLTYDYALNSRVYTGLAVAQPCPRCDGDVTVDDDVKDGTCNGGLNAGAPCDADGLSSSFGATSFDCLPTDASNIGNLSIRFDDATTGTKTRTPSVASPSCSATGFGAQKCFCDTCNNVDAQPCASNADCPPSGGAPGICGGRRCIGGTNAGALCAAASQCPGGGLCLRPGEPTRPDACLEDTSVMGSGACADAGGDQGVCPEGPVDSNCAAPEQFRGCTVPTQVADCPLTGTCVTANRRCFLPTVTRTGTPGPAGGEYAGDFCIAPTGASAVNNVAGLPGLGALILPYTIAVSVP